MMICIEIVKLQFAQIHFFFEYELKPNDKEVFIINDGFDVIKNILEENGGWIIEDIHFHNDGMFLIIGIEI